METKIKDPIISPDRKVLSAPISPIANSYGGYLVLAFSFFIYAITEAFSGTVEGDLLTIFFLHYFLALLYVGILIFYRSFGVVKVWKKENINRTIILLNLFLISAYALNREIPVFEDSTNWLCIYLIMTSLTTLSYHFYHALPVWVNRLQHFVLGSAIILYLYLALYVANFYVVGSFGILAFGIGAHVFVPLTLLIGSFFLYYAHRRTSYYWIIAGCTVTLVGAAIFMTEWKSRISAIEKITSQSVLNYDEELPAWMEVAKSLKNDWITHRILKLDLVYTGGNDKPAEFVFVPQRINWEEVKKHDPLVFLASLFDKCSLSEEDRVKILQAISDLRHQSNERLWSGSNLTTSFIISDVDIYPELRIAYTEKYLNVQNDGKNRWWGNTQEAIYTFILPEGSVVTSLSLWIDGKEEKAILTSKQKATTAYKTIVGVERRDPSVVHWQEGNRVTVRVFPCTSNEERKFKIGITSPLVEEAGQTRYKNITFYGPNASRAKETTRIRFTSEPNELDMSGDFKMGSNGEYLSEQRYNPDLKISFKSPTINPNNFSFGGFQYSIVEHKPRHQPIVFTSIYLDINNSWKDEEIGSLKKLLGKQHLYVHRDHSFIQLSEENWDVIINEMVEQNFSLFPFHKIKDTKNALVVTKGKVVSPHLNDFKESKFAEHVSEFFAEGKKVKVYNLTWSISTYITSLRELRGLEFASGSAAQLMMWITDQTFPMADESDEKVILHDAGLAITKNQSEENALADNAPDHLARLFVYNNIMRKIGAGYFKDDFLNDQLVDEASMAYVVSPVSSLIVLESKEDYDRFNIHDSENSLGNAVKKSSGAVPEPHEWALIIIFVLVVVYVRVRH